MSDDQVWADLPEEERKRQIAAARSQGKCGAAPHPTAQRQRPCMLAGTGAGGRCFRHGGRSLGHNLKHGRYSRFAPARVRALMQEAMDDPEILDLKPTLALYDVRIQLLLERLEEFDCPSYRAEARRMFTGVQEAMARGDLDATRASMRTLGNWLERGDTEGQAWRDLLTTASERSKRSEAAATVALRGENAVTARDLVVLVGNLMDVMVDECGAKHHKLAQRVAARWQRDVLPPRVEAPPPPGPSSEQYSGPSDQAGADVSEEEGPHDGPHQGPHDGPLPHAAVEPAEGDQP